MSGGIEGDGASGGRGVPEFFISIMGRAEGFAEASVSWVVEGFAEAVWRESQHLDGSVVPAGGKKRSLCYEGLREGC